MLEDRLKSIAQNVSAPCTWGWDNRYHTLFLVVNPAQARRLKTQFEGIFENNWTDEVSGDDVTDVVEGLVKTLSGIRQGQSLHCTGLEEGTIIFAAFWPWMGQPMVSIRLGVFEPAHAGAQPESLEMLKTIFDAEVD